MTRWSHIVRPVDLVFRSLADPGRRALLDRLAETDGLSVGELCEVLPDMTRFGVMKHLGLLEEAHLITTERHGRRKLHYLNPVPIQLIHDRWISRYVAPFTEALADLSSELEGELGHGRTPTHLRDVYPGDAG
ncbi:MAG: helix-turn-helix transcriptional regulator [Actinomycetia bacterium]|nr:helix-turn-helix transcriptional regulator [Actinomycetes bacterium]